MAKKNPPSGPPQLVVTCQPHPFAVLLQVKHFGAYPDVNIGITYPTAGQADVPPGALTVRGWVSTQQALVNVALSSGTAFLQQPGAIKGPATGGGYSWSASGFNVAPSTSYLVTAQATAAGGATASTSESFSTRASRVQHKQKRQRHRK